MIWLAYKNRSESLIVLTAFPRQDYSIEMNNVRNRRENENSRDKLWKFGMKLTLMVVSAK